MALDALTMESPAAYGDARNRQPVFSGRLPLGLIVLGSAAFLLAALSLLDLALPKAWDGVVLEADAPGQLIVRRVVPGSGAAEAGVRSGDRILGVDRTVLRSPPQAAEVLGSKSVGDRVPYLIRRGDGLHEVTVALGPRWVGSLAYLSAALLGFLFFGIGTYVLVKQPRRRTAQVFFLLATLFLLFLVCRLRPASYSWVDGFILTTGMLALLFLPAAFLHFFLIFPRPVRLRPELEEADYRRRRVVWLATLTLIYVLPCAVLVYELLSHQRTDRPLHLVSGAPLANWWVLAIYMLLGLAALAVNSRRVTDRRARRGAAMVFGGTVLGVVPFITLAVGFPSFLHTERFLLYGTVPLVLIPLTFAYAIARFELLDVKVILRKSLLYTATSVLVTLLYALGIVLVNGLLKESPLTDSPLLPIVFALIIVLLFEPLRRALMAFAQRFFSAERRRLQTTIRELSRAFTARVDLAATVRDLVERLPERLGIHFAALYLRRDERLERVAGPARLPVQLPDLPRLGGSGMRGQGLTRLTDLERTHPESGELLKRLQTAGVELVGELISPRRRLGLLLLSGRTDRMTFEREDLELLDDLLNQAAIAIETSLLLEERTRQVELQQEVKIAATIQNSLLPETADFGTGWRVGVACRPARDVGGDFLAELPAPRPGTKAVVWGDVAGKSVSGALVMMAAHEILHSLALADPDPARLLQRANQRLRQVGGSRSFVALGYLAPNEHGLLYSLAGQPPLLLRREDGRVEELPLPTHRLPLGALEEEGYAPLSVRLAPGEILLGYSDGVLDATSPDGEPFGEARLHELVGRSPAEPEPLVQAVLAALQAHSGDATPYDDITLVAVRRDQEESPCDD